MVWPMVAAGTSNDEIMAARDVRPDFRTTWTTARSLRDRRRDRHMSKHTLSVLVENKPGVLARITSLFSRRGFNIDSLAVAPPSTPRSPGSPSWSTSRTLPLEQVTKQLNKLVNVLKIVELDPAPPSSANSFW